MGSAVMSKKSPVSKKGAGAVVLTVLLLVFGIFKVGLAVTKLADLAEELARSRE